MGTDPGFRTAFTCVFGHGKTEEIGVDPKHILTKMDDKRVSILHRRRNSIGESRKRLTRAWYKNIARKKDVISDFHWKTAKHLLGNCNSVIIGRIGISGLISTTRQSDSSKKLFSLYAIFPLGNG